MNIEEKTFLQAMDVIEKFYETYRTAYTKDGISRNSKAAAFAVLVQRCTNWAVRAGHLKMAVNVKDMSALEVRNQYFRLVEIHENISA